MRVLVLNSGSSSLKIRILDVVQGDSTREPQPGPAVVMGAVKGIGGPGTLEFTAEGQPNSKTMQKVPTHAQAVQWLFERLPASCSEVEAVGHRVVHGGERFSCPVLIDDAVVKEIDALSELEDATPDPLGPKLR